MFRRFIKPFPIDTLEQHLQAWTALLRSDAHGKRHRNETLLYLLDALGGRGIEESNESQAVLTNLASVTEVE